MEIQVTEEIIASHSQNFGLSDSCPIAVSLKKFLKAGFIATVFYNGYEIRPTTPNEEMPWMNEILMAFNFPEEVPANYRSEEGEEYLEPFVANFEIPNQFLKEEFATV